jgi:hypothetical protein
MLHLYRRRRIQSISHEKDIACTDLPRDRLSIFANTSRRLALEFPVRKPDLDVMATTKR